VQLTQNSNGDGEVQKESLKTFSEAPLRLQDGPGALVPEPSNGFVSTPYVEELTHRALTYVEVGYPIHFAGPAGTR
jgi:hypothetical protein